MQLVMKKARLAEMLKLLMKKYEVIAPVRNGKDICFEIIDEDKLKNIDLSKNPLIPPKRFFLPPEETIIYFHNKKIVRPRSRRIRKRVIFGIRKCDINALARLDMVGLGESYAERRKATLLLGLHCEKPLDTCFCESMELELQGDLFFYRKDDNFIISINSARGERLVKWLAKHISMHKLASEYHPEIKTKKKLENKNIENLYHDKRWQELVDKCIACGACTMLCPTCSCFDIEDEISLDGKTGKRVRRETSCRLKSFTKIAGGIVTRETEESRMKHFVYHKIVYFKQRHGKMLCVGCGRCIRGCPARIDWVDFLNKLGKQDV